MTNPKPENIEDAFYNLLSKEDNLDLNTLSETITTLNSKVDQSTDISSLFTVETTGTSQSLLKRNALRKALRFNQRNLADRLGAMKAMVDLRLVDDLQSTVITTQDTMGNTLSPEMMRKRKELHRSENRTRRWQRSKTLLACREFC